MKKDLIVIGAGPAGSSAAYLAAKAGLDVLILEKEKWPRYKPCGGALSARSLNILAKYDLQFGPEIIENSISQFKFSFSAREEFILNYNKSPIELIDRKDFDNFLLEKAAAAGAEFRDKSEVIMFEEQRGKVLIKTRADSYYTSFLLAADGANSKFFRYLNPLLREKRVKNKGTAIEAEIKYQNLKNNVFKDQIMVDFKYLANGYGWVFPKKEYLSVGLGILKFEKADLKKILANYLRELGIEVESGEFLLRAHPIPVYNDRPEFKRAKGRILLAGDAAYLADAFIGEGIYYALASGFAAANSIIESKNYKSVSENYQSQLERNLFPELKAAENTAKLFYNNKRIVKLLLKRREDLLITFMDAVQGLESYAELGKLFNFLRNLFRIKI